jgi:hypothetical protein
MGETVAVASRRYWIVSVLPFQRGIIEHFTRRSILGLLDMNHLLSVCAHLSLFLQRKAAIRLVDTARF